VTDFESRLKQPLDNRVDAVVGSSRPAPRLHHSTGRQPSSSRSRWVLPLLAATVITAVATGTAIAANMHSDRRRPTATATNSPTARATATPSGTTTSHTASPTSPSPSSATGTPGATHALLGGANVGLPAGWTARNYSQYLTAGEVLARPTWCITPDTTPPSTTQGACTLTLSMVDPDKDRLDADEFGGFTGNSDGCHGSTTPVGHISEQSGDRTFGARAADWRQWEITCPTLSSPQRTVEQYVVTTAPAFVLFSDQAGSTVHGVMTWIAGHSTLPAQTLAVRLYDYGIVRAATPTASGVRISLDRVVRDLPDGNPNNNPRTYEYTIPTDLYDASMAIPGSTVTLTSDGSTVIEFYRG